MSQQQLRQFHGLGFGNNTGTLYIRPCKKWSSVAPEWPLLSCLCREILASLCSDEHAQPKAAIHSSCHGRSCAKRPGDGTRSKSPALSADGSRELPQSEIERSEGETRGDSRNGRENGWVYILGTCRFEVNVGVLSNTARKLDWKKTLTLKVNEFISRVCLTTFSQGLILILYFYWERNLLVHLFWLRWRHLLGGWVT